MGHLGSAENVLIDGQTLLCMPGGKRGRIVGLVQAPATKLVRLLSEPGAQLARVLQARGGQDA